MSSSTYECFCRSVASLFGWSDWCQRFYSELECWDQANEVLRQSWPQSNDEWVSLAINYSLKYDISNPSASYATSDSYTTDNSNRTSGSKWPSHDDETGTSESEKDKDSVVSSTSTTGTDTEKAGTSGDAGKTQIQFEKRPLAAPREKTLEEFWMPHRIPVDTLLPASYPFTVPLEDFSALLECSYAVPLNVDHSGNILSSSFASAVYSVLDSPNVPGPLFKAFLWSYDLFICPAHLLQIVILFYRLQHNIEGEDKMSDPELSPRTQKLSHVEPLTTLSFRRSQGMPPQIGPVNLLVELVMLFYCRLKEDRAWNLYFNKFIQFLEYQGDLNQAKRLSKAWATQEQRYKCIDNLLCSVSFEYELSSVSIMDFSPAHIAHQLTFNTHLMVQVTSIDEYRFWTRARKHRDILCPNLNVLVEWFNDLSNWVATTILTNAGTHKDKAGVIVHWLKVMEEVERLNNFEGMMPLYLALQLQPIRNLKDAWKVVPKKFLNSFQMASDFLSQAQNFKHYRNRLRELNQLQPHIPIHAVIMKDLTVVEELPTKLDDGSINWVKLNTYSDILEAARISRSNLYQLENYPELQKVIVHGINTSLDLEKMYELSKHWNRAQGSTKGKRSTNESHTSGSSDQGEARSLTIESGDSMVGSSDSGIAKSTSSSPKITNSQLRGNAEVNNLPPDSPTSSNSHGSKSPYGSLVRNDSPKSSRKHLPTQPQSISQDPKKFSLSWRFLGKRKEGSPKRDQTEMEMSQEQQIQIQRKQLQEMQYQLQLMQRQSSVGKEAPGTSPEQENRLTPEQLPPKQLQMHQQQKQFAKEQYSSSRKTPSPPRIKSRPCRVNIQNVGFDLPDLDSSQGSDQHEEIASGIPPLPEPPKMTKSTPLPLPLQTTPTMEITETSDGEEPRLYLQGARPRSRSRTFKIEDSPDAIYTRVKISPRTAARGDSAPLRSRSSSNPRDITIARRMPDIPTLALTKTNLDPDGLRATSATSAPTTPTSFSTSPPSPAENMRRKRAITSSPNIQYMGPCTLPNGTSDNSGIVCGSGSGSGSESPSPRVFSHIREGAIANPVEDIRPRSSIPTLSQRIHFMRTDHPQSQIQQTKQVQSSSQPLSPSDLLPFPDKLDYFSKQHINPIDLEQNSLRTEASSIEPLKMLSPSPGSDSSNPSLIYTKSFVHDVQVLNFSRNRSDSGQPAEMQQARLVQFQAPLEANAKSPLQSPTVRSPTSSTPTSTTTSPIAGRIQKKQSRGEVVEVAVLETKVFSHMDYSPGRSK